MRAPVAGRRISILRTFKSWHFPKKTSNTSRIPREAGRSAIAAEIPAYTEKLGKIIEFIDELGKAGTDDNAAHGAPAVDANQRLRPDEVTETDERVIVIQENAPENQ